MLQSRLPSPWEASPALSVALPCCGSVSGTVTEGFAEPSLAVLVQHRMHRMTKSKDPKLLTVHGSQALGMGLEAPV